MRDRGASEVERRAVRRISVERMVACRTALGEGGTAIFAIPVQQSLTETWVKMATPFCRDGRGAAALRGRRARRASSAPCARRRRASGSSRRQIASLSTHGAPGSTGSPLSTRRAEKSTRATTEWHEQILALQHVQPHDACSSSARATAPSAARSSTIGRRATSPSSPTRACGRRSPRTSPPTTAARSARSSRASPRAGRSSSASSTPPPATARAQAPAAADAPAACRTVEDLERLSDGTRQPFTALIADCEGFLGTFLDENPRLLDGLELVVYEEDAKDVCDYAGIRRLLARTPSNAWSPASRMSGGARATTLAWLSYTRSRTVCIL